MISRYLTTKSSQSGAPVDQILSKLHAILKERKSKPVDLDGLKVLDTVEKAHATSPDAIGEFKFASNADMLSHIERGRV